MPKRSLLLTLDAFGTIFHPRVPVPDQYASVAHSFGLTSITPSSLQQSFKPAFKAQAAKYPNYGREDVIKGRYGGPKEWWAEIIKASFAAAHASTNNGKVDVPDALISKLLDRFASKEGYVLYDDADPFFARLREMKSKALSSSPGGRQGPFENIVVGVVSNSDDRVPAVLRSLGLSVGSVRADQGVSSLRLPGFEERDSTTSNINGGVAGEVNDLDLIITSYEAGEEKPSRVIFDVAKRQAEAMAGEESEWVCIHVGDEYIKDYRGAVDAGWDGYLLPRGEDIPEGTKTIESLMDLFEVLEGYN